MNIFYLSHLTYECAEMHCDAHIIKMMLEYAQLLSTAHRVLNPKLPAYKCYRATHVNHPCAVWVRESRSHYVWLYNLMLCLEEEWRWRWQHKRVHESIRKHGDFLIDPPASVPRKLFVDPPQCMPPQYQVQRSTVEAYRSYYNHGKRHIAKWTRRGAPSWWLEEVES